MSQGLRTSEAVRQAGYEAAPVRAVTRPYTTRALPYRLPGRPRQQRIAVEVGPGDGVRQVAALDVHIEVVEEPVVRARRDPGKRIGDGRPPGYFRALRAREGVARSVVPVHIDVERTLV